ncbi:aminoglycoside phosphotransferase [Paraoerskovia sediminicola]|uniref:Aminoglycoside phosphotransferase n=1 Tax=Paraoerskovia sediminicola TaxID=1138587 RepID=A0ABM8G5K3_9CELL|nr:aminoglycoside phosphotransferase family protein [Paraoerskovia sediminicola]BDZ43383.1 aminoglycoside phosphotransferase [Paraoerskovia sediminicola]
MPDSPAAEVAVTTELVRDLLRAQHPDQAGLPLRVVTNGWDNVVLRLGDDLAVRAPRRALAAPLVLHEQRWLPTLAQHLPVPVPAPVRVGTPTAAYPWSWSVVPWFEGQAAIEVAPHDRRGVAVDLARFVGALHRLAPQDAPRNPYRGVPLADRDADVRGRLAGLHDALSARPRDTDAPGLPDLTERELRDVEDLWGEAVRTDPWDGEPVWLHGDLHPGNLILDHPGRLAAVIDFGDLTSGDPATDLGTAWLTFDDVGRREFRQALGVERSPDDATWLRARGWAVVLGSALLAHSDDTPAHREVGLHALRSVLSD